MPETVDTQKMTQVEINPAAWEETAMALFKGNFSKFSVDNGGKTLFMARADAVTLRSLLPEGAVTRIEMEKEGNGVKDKDDDGDTMDELFGDTVGNYLNRVNSGR